MQSTCKIPGLSYSTTLLLWWYCRADQTVHHVCRVKTLAAFRFLVQLPAILLPYACNGNILPRMDRYSRMKEFYFPGKPPSHDTGYLTAIIDWYSRKIRSACCGRPWRECDRVGMQKRPPRVAGQYNRPNAFRQGNLLTQTAGGCTPQALRLRYSQNQNSFAIDFQKWF